jgi:Glucose / Sorbosone dehydrogenase
VAQETRGDYHNLAQIAFRPVATPSDDDTVAIKSTLSECDYSQWDSHEQCFCGSKPATASARNHVGYAAGLRNPHRYEWDTSAGKLYLSDIGQSYLQEVNIVDNGAKTTVGPTQEGTFVICNDASENIYEIKAGVTDTYQYPGDPITTMTKLDNAISGATVYNGVNMPALRGEYVFGDLVSGRMFHATATPYWKLGSCTCRQHAHQLEPSSDVCG